MTHGSCTVCATSSEEVMCWNAYGLAAANCGIQAAAANPLLLAAWWRSKRDFPEGSGFSGGLCHKTNPPTHNNLCMEYLCETTSDEGLVQLLACNYLPHGYWFYVTGWIPEGKDPRRVDTKLIEKYETNLSRATRSRRKHLGYANIQYLRCGRFFVLIATHGKHRFFEEEAACIQDIRRVPLKFTGYSISYRRGGRAADGKPDCQWHSHVEIDREWYKLMQAQYCDAAIQDSTKRLALRFFHFPFEPYAPIRRQMFNLLKMVNTIRHRAGLGVLPYTVLPLRRRVVRPFELAPRWTMVSKMERSPTCGSADPSE